MARKIIQTILDDLDGTEGADTVTFALDGKSYEIDLSEDNRAALAEALAPYIKAGRRVSTNSFTPKASSRRAPAAGDGRTDLAAVREWAAANGIAVSDRGRVAKSVLDQYDAAQ